MKTPPRPADGSAVKGAHGQAGWLGWEPQHSHRGRKDQVPQVVLWLPHVPHGMYMPSSFTNQFKESSETSVLEISLCIKWSAILWQSETSMDKDSLSLIVCPKQSWVCQIHRLQFAPLHGSLISSYWILSASCTPYFLLLPWWGCRQTVL